MNTLRKFATAACAIALAAPLIVSAQIATGPALTILDTQVFCQGSQPYVTFTLPVIPVDFGRPGIYYIGMRDAPGTAAMFLTPTGWVQWQSGMFSPFETLAGGMGARRFTLALNPALAGGGWTLYAGYGVLDAPHEAKVIEYARTVEETKALARGPIGSVDPEHYRRTYIQADMVKAGKFAYVNTGTENNPDVCNPEKR